MMKPFKRTRPAAATPPRAKPSVFIISSQEAKDRGILHTVIDGLHERFTPRPWDSEFPPDRESTLQSLLRVSREVDAAVVLCAHDDLTSKRGTVSPVARDNVLLEYGLFLSALGLDRVSVLWEEGVAPPTDLLGLNLRFFKSDGHRSRVEDDAMLRSSLGRCVQQVAAAWQTLEPRMTGRRAFSDGGAAVAGTLEHADERIRDISAKLEKFATTGETQAKPFIRFDSSALSLRAYAEGLKAVQNRFWTTTFLTSGFWAKQNAQVMEGNKTMLSRIRPAGGEVKRLFLLEAPPPREIDRLQQRMIYLRQVGSTDDIQEMWIDLQGLRKSFRQLIDLNCEVKVAHDHGKLAARLPEELAVDPHDSEIALYDDFRVDVFGGGRLGAVYNVNVFSRAYGLFDSVREAAESYFDQLWEHGEPGMDFIHALERAYEVADRRIDYNSNWLAQFEYHLESRDQELKTAESKRVVEVLDAMDRLGRIQRYLDIGSCTGRYPRELRQHVVPEGRIVGVDLDIDCIRFAQNHPDLLRDPDARISFELMDFTAEDGHELGQFDLITCMLSTISHFGVNRFRRPEDTLQRALQRARELLAPDGVFIFTAYSEQACATRDLLKIYQKQEMERLANGTPRHHDMRQRLDAVGLRVVEEPRPDLRLDMYVCQHAN